MFYRNPSDEIQTQGKLDLANLMVDLVSKVDEDEIHLNSTSSELLASPSRFVWLKAFGVFIGLLGSLVLLTLLTCRRPKQSVEVERIEEPVYVVEAPPCYQSIIEAEAKYLPSYREAVE